MGRPSCCRYDLNAFRVFCPQNRTAVLEAFCALQSKPIHVLEQRTVFDFFFNNSGGKYSALAETRVRVFIVSDNVPTFSMYHGGRQRGKRTGEQTDQKQARITTEAANKVDHTNLSTVDSKRRRRFSRTKSVVIMSEISSSTLTFPFVMALSLVFILR